MFWWNSFNQCLINNQKISIELDQLNANFILFSNYYQTIGIILCYYYYYYYVTIITITSLFDNTYKILHQYAKQNVFGKYYQVSVFIDL